MAHNNQAVLQAYCQKVVNQLVCKKSTKKHLLSALQEELTDAAQGCSAYEELAARVGTPTEIAKQLQDSVSDQEYAAALKQARLNRFLLPAILVLSLFLIAATLTYAYYIWNSVPVYYTETVAEGDSLPEGFIIGKEY